jgi:hypothetical protein
MRIWRISSMWIAAALGAAALAGAQGQERQAGGRPEPPPASPAPPSREQAERTADTLLERAGSAADAALAWLERRGEGAETTLREALDGAAGRAKGSRQLGLRLLTAAQDPEKDAPAWGPLPERTPARLVLLVHGMDEPGGIWDDLAPALAAAGHAVARRSTPTTSRWPTRRWTSPRRCATCAGGAHRPWTSSPTPPAGWSRATC